MPIRQTLEQQRAKAAWQATPSQPSSDYVGLAQGAPVTVLTNGLAQALAFFLTKKDAHYQQYRDALAAWALGENGTPREGATAQDLMDALLQADVAAYRRHTAEALAYMNWLKRFAKARADVPAAAENA